MVVECVAIMASVILSTCLDVC